MDIDNRQRARPGAGTAVYAPEGEDGQAREGKGRRGRRGLGMRRDARKEKGEKGLERGNIGRSTNTRPSSRRRGGFHRSVQQSREGRSQRAARYEALAHVERQRRRHQPPEPRPDTSYRLQMESRRMRWGRQGGLERSGGEHSGQPSGGVRREGGLAEHSSAAAEGRRGQQEGEQGVGASKVDTRAARCRAGVQDK